MAQFHLGAKIIDTHQAADGRWRVRPFLWPDSVLLAHPGGDPSFESEELAIQAGERGAGRRLRAVVECGEPTVALPTPPISTPTTGIAAPPSSPTRSPEGPPRVASATEPA